MRSETKLEANSIVIERLDRNPFAHSDTAHAQVGNYLFSSLDAFVIREYAATSAQ
jgi:hypothetical protein